MTEPSGKNRPDPISEASRKAREPLPLIDVLNSSGDTVHVEAGEKRVAKVTRKPAEPSACEHDFLAEAMCHKCHKYFDPTEMCKTVAALQARVEECEKALRECKCIRCIGKGTWETSCSMCGDSTYDHVCDDETVKCDACDGTGLHPSARAALAGKGKG